MSREKVKFLKDQALSKIKSNDYFEALNDLEKAIKMDPEDPELYLHLSEVYYLIHHAPEAERKRMDELLSFSLDDLTTYREKMKQTLYQGIDMGIKIKSRVVQSSFVRLYHWGILLTEDKAKLNEILLIPSEGNAALLFHQGCLKKIYLNDLRSAQADLTESIQLEPHPETYCERAWIRKQLGDLAGALEDYHAGLQLEPEHLAMRKGRAELYFQKQDWAGVIEDCSVVLGLDQDYSYGRMQRVCALVEMEKEDQALNDLEYLFKSPKTPEDGIFIFDWLQKLPHRNKAFWLAGNVLIKIGYKEESQRFFNEVRINELSEWLDEHPEYK